MFCREYLQGTMVKNDGQIVTSYCQLPNNLRGATCPVCGFSLPYDLPSGPVRVPCNVLGSGGNSGIGRHVVTNVPPLPDPLSCLHLGEPTGENVEQLKCGCPGARMTGVWTCEIKGECAPLARVKTLADETVAACPCEHYATE